jgi:hypothetical protein
MKKLFVLIMLLVASQFLFAQTTYVKVVDRQTKYEQLTKQTSTQCRFEDHNLPTLYGMQSRELETSVRCVNADGTVSYFYRICTKEKKDVPSTQALVAFDDFVELNQMLETMLEQEKSDRTSRKDYAENVYTTSDGFQLGYGTKNRNTDWFIVFGPYSEDRIYFENGTRLKDNFQKALKKVDELKKKNDK